jgi:hypothetical protein
VPTLLLLAACAALALPAQALAQDAEPLASSATGAPSTLVLGGSLAGGAELGLASGKAGLLELELLAGWDIPGSAAGTGLVIRPELALALGAAPDGHVALRPGLRLAIPTTPLWLRAALDWSTARRKEPAWRWALVGAAWEIRMTSFLGFDFEVDTGVPVSGRSGLPLLLRAGATFRP